MFSIRYRYQGSLTVWEIRLEEPNAILAGRVWEVLKIMPHIIMVSAKPTAQ